MQFIEDEAWDVSLDKTINISANLPKEEKQYFIPVYTPSNVTPSTPIKVKPTCQMTPSSSIRKSPHTQANTLSTMQQTPS